MESQELEKMINDIVKSYVNAELEKIKLEKEINSKEEKEEECYLNFKIR